jgi:hypothetical protein
VIPELFMQPITLDQNLVDHISIPTPPAPVIPELFMQPITLDQQIKNTVLETPARSMKSVQDMFPMHHKKAKSIWKQYSVLSRSKTKVSLK